MLGAIFAVLVACTGGGEARQGKPALDALAWMAGAWSGTARGIEMEEQWTVPKGNSMIGLHRDVGKGRTLGFEFLRIEQQADSIVYLSMPNGRSPASRARRTARKEARSGGGVPRSRG